MLLIILMLVGFCFFLFAQLWELRNRMENIEKILKSMNHDLNMVSKTMDNQKQILKG